MLRNIYFISFFPWDQDFEFSIRKFSTSPYKNPALKEAKEYKKNKRGRERKAKKGKNTHHLCHESECRRLFGTLEQDSTTHRLLSINNPDRLLPGTSPPQKNSKTKTNALQVLSDNTLFLRSLFTSEASFRTRTCSWRACGILWPPLQGESSSLENKPWYLRVWYIIRVIIVSRVWCSGFL